MHSDSASQLASNLFKFTKKKRNVCLCNTPCRYEELKKTHLNPVLRTHHGSLDHLLQHSEKHRPPGSLHQKDVVMALENCSAFSSESLSVDFEETKVNSLCSAITKQTKPTVSHTNFTEIRSDNSKENFEQGVKEEKFIRRFNGDLLEITKRTRSQNEEKLEYKCFCRNGSVLLSDDSPSFKPCRDYKKDNLSPIDSSCENTTAKMHSIQQSPYSLKKDLQLFDRVLHTTSAEGVSVGKEKIIFLDSTQIGSNEATVLKNEVPGSFLEELAKKPFKKQQDSISTKEKLLTTPLEVRKNEHCRLKTSCNEKSFVEDMIERSTEANGISVLKTDLIDWLKQFQGLNGLENFNSSQKKIQNKIKRRQKCNAMSFSNEESNQSTKFIGKTFDVKYSNGYNLRSPNKTNDELFSYQGSGSESHKTSSVKKNRSTTNYTQPLEKQMLSTCRTHNFDTKFNRKLKHSSSDILNGAQPIYAKPQKKRFHLFSKEDNFKLHNKATSTITKTNRERSRRNLTRRSATVSDISSHEKHKNQKSSSADPTPRSTSPCTDPNCRLMPICTDQHCKFLNCRSNAKRNVSYSATNVTNRPTDISKMSETSISCPLLKPSLPFINITQSKQNFVLCKECRSCSPLFTCHNKKCVNATKCNSLPHSIGDFNRLGSNLDSSNLCDIQAASFGFTSKTMDEEPPPLSKNLYVNSSTKLSTYYEPHTYDNKECANSSTSDLQSKNNQTMNRSVCRSKKLIKSVSNVSINSRLRRHKTVHFGENLLREVCQNRKLINIQHVPSASAPMNSNIQMLYNFVERVLSAWVDDKRESYRSGAESEPEHSTSSLKRIHRCNRLRYNSIKRIVEEAAKLTGTLKLGNSRFRHRHWRSTAKQCNELFLIKISDDDRMSLTTAVSDDDDGESVMTSPNKSKTNGNVSSSFNCTGAVRKAGFLSVKKWLLRKKHQIELARKRGWKGYWVCLKGTTLLFYPCESREGRSVEAAPKHLIIVDGAIMQPIPEHPKRDYIFCLSTAFGDAYLFQAPCQVELENWVNSIHSACAAAFARHRGKTGTLHLLQEEIFRLEKAIESDQKLKHMAELQQSVVTEQETRHQIQVQILQWEENLERLHCEQFRLRCYMASLQSGELPNPKSLLTHVSRPTKNTLNKLGVFTVSSFHAFICARSPSLLHNLLAGRGATKRRLPVLSRSNSGSSRRSSQMNSHEETEKSFKVIMPGNVYSTVFLSETMSIEEFLTAACKRRNLNPMEYFVRVKKRRDMEDHNYFVPHRNDLIENYMHNHEFIEVCMKILYQVELQRTSLEHMWGFSVEAELIENADRQDELCCYVSRVEDKSVAMHNGIIKGDEIMVINSAIVSDLDMMYLESVLQEEQSLCMMMRSSRTEPPDLVGIMCVTDDIIDSLVCPPPPTDPPVMSEEMISGLIVPAPGWNGNKQDMAWKEAERSSDQPFLDLGETFSVKTQQIETKPPSVQNSSDIENLIKTAEQVTGFCRSPQETRKSSPTGSATSSVSTTVLTPSRQLPNAEKLRKVILELVETERTYVKHLNNLLEHYLEPLKRETILSHSEINALFGNIHEIVTFQRQFLRNLEEALALEQNFENLEHSSDFRSVLFAIGSAFLYYVNHFKLYSSFCASHSKAQKILHPNDGNHILQEFLSARNPKQQHSSTLESYLIKPIQRILKYPLLLQQMRNLTDNDAEEHLHLCEALKGMEKVAEHINEMQRIHEEYGAIFDHLFRQHQKSCKQPIDLSPGDLLYYGGVEWLNISDFLGKIKKGLELHAMCFVFKSAVVFLCKERLRQKKKLMGVSSKNTNSEVEIIRYQVLIPVTEVQVRTSSAKDMDSHFLWELIHLRSQILRRSEKVYVLSNSTADFRNAFLKTIRQIIRESVRNMSLPTKGFDRSNCVTGSSSQSHDSNCSSFSGISHTLERPKHQMSMDHGSHTLGKTRKKPESQRHSAINIDYDNISGSQEELYNIQQHWSSIHRQLLSNTFRGRSKTLGDAPDRTSPSTESLPGINIIAGQSHRQFNHKHNQQIKYQQIQPHSDLIEPIDSGTKSEEDDFQNGNLETPLSTVEKSKATLERTPHQLTLSTSTLSVGSTGSQARLIQSSHQPSNYNPVVMMELGSPVWKPRDTANLEMDAQLSPTKAD